MEEIMIERIVPWTLNDAPQHAFACTPEHLEELAYGTLFTQCGVTKAEDVVAVDVGENGIAVTLRDGVELPHRDLAERLVACTPCDSTFTVEKTCIKDMCRRLLADEDYFGTHRLMLRYGDAEVFREDVGRHNAADKCIAHGLKRQWNMHDCILGSTGRISLEMLAKTAAMGIPVFFSRKYPSDIAVEWAEKLNIAIVARAHTDDAAVYGAAWRIT